MRGHALRTVLGVVGAMVVLTAGVALVHAAWRTFSALSTTVATSERRTGLPFRYATIVGSVLCASPVEPLATLNTYVLIIT